MSPAYSMNKKTQTAYGQVVEYLQQHREEFLADLMELIRIPSVCAPAQEGAPFGPACAQALDWAVARARDFGLVSEHLEHKVAYADLNHNPPQLDILAHLDVVPAGDGWTVTEPFQPLLQEGKLYGRGTCDDKGPAVAALYALRAIRELGLPLRYNARLILGADEETGRRDTDCYYSRFPEAPCSFSPDGEYPVINLEKGGLYTSYEGSWEGESPLPRICRIDAGTVGNAVPGKALAVTEGLDLDKIRAAAARMEAQTGITFTLEQEGARIVIQAVGKGAHASTPWEGRSALTGLLSLLMELPFAPCPGLERLQGLARLFPHGEFYGRAVGVAQSDALSGDLVLTSNVLHYDGLENTISGRVDCRAPLCANEDNVLAVLREKMSAYGLYLPEDCHMLPAHHVPEDSPFVQTLLRCYEDVMEEPGRCLTIGGGTYAHFLKNGVAFGACRYGVDYHMHGPDEYLVVEEMLRSAQLFALVILELCGEDAPDLSKSGT